MVMAAALIEARNIKRHLRKRDNNIDRVVKAIEKGYRWGGKPVEIPGTKLPTRTQILLDLFAFVLFLSGTFIWAYAEYLGI